MAAPPEVRQTHVMGTGDGLKVTELFGRLLDWVKQHRSPDTYVWYQYRLQRFAARFPDLTVEQLRPFHVQEWVDSFPNHSPTTTRNYMRSVKRCIKWGQSLGYIDTNPIRHISIPASRPKDCKRRRELVAIGGRKVQRPALAPLLPFCDWSRSHGESMENGIPKSVWEF